MPFMAIILLQTDTTLCQRICLCISKCFKQKRTVQQFEHIELSVLINSVKRTWGNIIVIVSQSVHFANLTTISCNYVSWIYNFIISKRLCAVASKSNDELILVSLFSTRSQNWMPEELDRPFVHVSFWPAVDAIFSSGPRSTSLSLSHWLVSILQYRRHVWMLAVHLRMASSLR